MTSMIEQASALLLSPSDCGVAELEKTLSQAMFNSVDYADIYLQSSCSEDWFLEEGIVKEGSYSVNRGFGVRVVSGEKTGYAYADEISKAALSKAVTSASSIVRSSKNATVKVTQSPFEANIYPAINPLLSLSADEKVALLKDIDKKAREQDSRISDVEVHLSSTYDAVLIMNSQGLLTADIRPLVELTVRVVVLQDDQREQAMAGGGGRYDLKELIQPDRIQSYIDKAIRQALLNLEAQPAPAGVMPVVLGPGWPGVLLHEAVGHGLEGDFNRKQTSAFTDKLGERVASDLCTIVDDATLPNRRGSIRIDGEGTPGQNTVLIENGILKNYMQDWHNAHLMGSNSTGNGRRESYAHLPVPRMTNTYMLAGKTHPDEIIASVDHGLYALDFSGGEVDITSGKFVFTASEAYLIKKGKIMHPVRGAALIGNGPDILTKVTMVGNDLKLDPGIGTCGKAGQSVPVGVGQPSVKIEAMTVGGVK